MYCDGDTLNVHVIKIDGDRWLHGCMYYYWLVYSFCRHSTYILFDIFITEYEKRDIMNDGGQIFLCSGSL